MKTRGYLTHPDHHMYIILKHLEMCFSKHVNSTDVFEETCNEFFKTKVGLKFMCLEHQSEMLTKIISYYLTMRMRQYTYMLNQNTKKHNNTKKKIVKIGENLILYNFIIYLILCYLYYAIILKINMLCYLYMHLLFLKNFL